MQRIFKLSVGPAVLVGVCTWCTPRGASAQALAVQGDHFTVDGNAKFSHS